MVLLEEDGALPSTLLLRLLYACCLCWLTFNWKGFQHPEYTPESPPPDTLIQHLSEYLWTSITGYWKTGEGVHHNLALAHAIRAVTAAGLTRLDHFVHPQSRGGGWRPTSPQIIGQFWSLGQEPD
eukprot:402514-Rhodomonas_salina.1